jgi:MYXO-CTERM domain-containing protein
MKKLAIMAAAVGALVVPRAAEAFCGFYVNGAGSEMYNDATQVTLMRMGTRTVLSMQNNYKGPTEAFALVIPVPVVLQETDVKTLPKEVFAKIDQMGAPRLVEYWEMDPCAPDYPMDMPKGTGVRFAAEGDTRQKNGKSLGVTVEAEFTVGEYQIVILSAKDSSGLDTWLRQEKYQIPAGAEPLLRPYVAAGSKFFVAKVDPKKVKFESDGRADLSPLRFHYDADDFSLPIRLGLANSSGTQDLIVNILAPSQRFEVANYKNVTIPTNLDVKDEVRTRFGEFYAALYDKTVEKNPGAVVTEYAWQATTCDPCPGPQLDYHDLATLGSDVLAGEKGKPAPYQGIDFVHTRLHARYGKTITDDLVFKAADPIVGGREFVVADGKLEEGAKKDATNNFQGRYAIRHEWTGPIKCDKPLRGRWGGPPADLNVTYKVQPAMDLAFVTRGQARLPELVKRDIPEIGVKATAAGGTEPTTDQAGSAAAPTDDKPTGTEYKAGKDGKGKGGCGCATGGGGAGQGAAMGLIALGVLAAIGRRRRGRQGE